MSTRSGVSVVCELSKRRPRELKSWTISFPCPNSRANSRADWRRRHRQAIGPSMRRFSTVRCRPKGCAADGMCDLPTSKSSPKNWERRSPNARKKQRPSQCRPLSPPTCSRWPISLIDWIIAAAIGNAVSADCLRNTDCQSFGAVAVSISSPSGNMPRSSRR